MFDYSVFGGCLRSEIPFPELRPISSRQPTWTLRRSDRPTVAAESVLLGTDTVDGPVKVRLFKTGRGFQLVYDDTGCFDVSASGAEIHWHPGQNARVEAARLDVIGRVLALAAHAAGGLCLHGSAVATEGGGIAFLAPKYHGKSTLAHALVAAGARLATDDAVPVELGTPVMMRPGVHRIRLWTDSAERVGQAGFKIDPSAVDKHCLDQLPADRLMTRPVPLSAVYLLAPTPSEAGGSAVERQRLPSVPAALSLVRNATVGPLLGGPESEAVLERAVALARVVPVFALKVVRDFERLPEVVEQLMEWHEGAPLAGSAAAVGNP